MRFFHLLILFSLLMSLGCGRAPSPYTEPKSSYSAASPPAKDAAKNVKFAQPEGGAGGGRGGPEKAAEQAADKPLPRKVIYNAELKLIVKDLDESQKELLRIIREQDAYIANAEISGSTGTQRSGYWRLRVPEDHFDALLEAVVHLGIPDKNRRDSQDVSEEFYDLVDRIKNKKLEQDTLRGYLQDKKNTSKLEEILLIEKELSRVRGEMDTMEGQLRRLKDLTALATVTITLQEDKDYIPPQAPTFGDTIGTTFTSSLNLLESFGKFLLLAIVALAPWLVVLTLVAGLSWLVLRQRIHFRPRSVRSGDSPPDS